MRRRLIGIAVIIAAIAVVAAALRNMHFSVYKAEQSSYTEQQSFSFNVMKLSSPDFGDQADIPRQFTCDGTNARPRFSISGVPQTAKALALLVDDPDSVSGHFTHWLVWNIPPEVTVLSASELPAESREGLNDFGKSGYGAPCPGQGKHHYQFRLYALDTELALAAGSTATEVQRAMQGHILEQTLLVGNYQRSQQ